MSWDSYIDNLIGRSQGNADCACIIGQDGSKWTTDAHANSLKITPPEAASLSSAMKGDYSPLQQNGIKLGGIKYQFLRGEEKLVLGKKKDYGSVTIQATKTALVIGHTKEGAQQGNVNLAVSSIAEYLESLNM